MKALFALLFELPGLFSRLLDFLAARQKQAERETIRAEERAALNIEAERAELQQLKETIHAQDVAADNLPDVRAAAQRMRDGEF